MRLFAAVELSLDTRAAMAAEQDRVRTALDAAAGSLKWARPDNAHLTLVFVGDVDAARVAPLAAAFSCDIDLPPFDLTFSGLGIFPERGAPRVLWTGVANGMDALTALQRELAARVVAQGIALEARAFHPHLTVARWSGSRPSDRARVQAANRTGILSRQHVASAVLYQSRLLPGGARYSAVAHANLTGA